MEEVDEEEFLGDDARVFTWKCLRLFIYFFFLSFFFFVKVSMEF